MDDKDTLRAIATNLTQSVRRRLILWTVRWVIGFGIIALLVHFWPASSWLWWIGGTVAALSLAATLVTQFALQRKIAAVQTKAAEMERLAAEIDGEAYDGSDPAEERS